LTGEEELWFWIARTLGKSVSEAKSSVTATELIRWQSVREQEPNEFHWMKWYLAQVAYEIYLLRFVWTADPKKKKAKPDLKLKDFIVEFGVNKDKDGSGKKEENKLPLPEDYTHPDADRKMPAAARARMYQSKFAWAAFLGQAIPAKVPPPAPPAAAPSVKLQGKP
jgi:hypothetical protein